MLSYVENIPAIVNLVTEINPASIIDVGAGFGKYGLLCREALLSKRAEMGELSPTDDLTVDAVEDTPYFLYDGGTLDAVYNRVYPISAFDVLPDDWHLYQIALLIDIVEHYPKDKVVELLERITGHGCRVLVSTPKATHMYTQEYYGDPRHHITQWEREDFGKFAIHRDVSNELSHILLLGKA